MKELIEKAKEAARNSYSPYSRFKVGAALITKSGKIYSGTNVENASYGLANCAERTAVFKAVSEGEREITAIAVFTDTKKLTPPCGACRQVLSEFAKDMNVFVSNGKDKKAYKLSDLLPEAFSPHNLE